MVDSDERDANTSRASAPGGPGDPGDADGTDGSGDWTTDGSGDWTDPAHGPTEPDLDDLLAKLDALSDTVDEGHEREKVRQTISLVERMPGTGALAERITKYTSRDLVESFVGAILFALPLLVEGGVFEIAAWFASTTVAGVPVLLIGHVGFIFLATAGLLYFADFRQITIRHPIFGVIPRRYAGVLLVSLTTSAAMLLFWGRLHEGDPTALERTGRIAVVWAAAAFGAGLGDILPGESQGEDLGKFDLDIGDDD